ncbi:MAG: hypothetical protein ACHQZS_10435 [Candidatus Binatales bacterium]
MAKASRKPAVVPATVDVAKLKGILAPAPRRVTLKDMEAAIRKRAARRAGLLRR